MSSWPPSPESRRKVAAHVVTDVAAIGALAALSLWGDLPSWIAAVIIGAVAGAYALQANRPGPPVSGLVGALTSIAEILRGMKG